MKKLKISLSKNDLEYIANGHEIKIKVEDKSFLEVDEIILKPALMNDIVNPLMNYKHKIIDTEQTSFVNNFLGGAM